MCSLSRLVVVSEPLKCQDDDNIEPPAELNESVLQLSEDTAELLQKIDMFTQERKEVMQKMENLKEENDMLTVKVSSYAFYSLKQFVISLILFIFV